MISVVYCDGTGTYVIVRARNALSRHETSEGTVRYHRCHCGSLIVEHEGSARHVGAPLAPAEGHDFSKREPAAPSVTPPTTSGDTALGGDPS